ncbi:MAG: hypothetical protein H6Q69_4780 [Firmicutes bacterium]|nr:hypothetical protein [Bacillota bacterium]
MDTESLKHSPCPRVSHEPEKYENEYYKSVMQLIDSKSETAQVGSKQLVPNGKVIDIIAAIEASIAAIKEKEEPKKKWKTVKNKSLACAGGIGIY